MINQTIPTLSTPPSSNSASDFRSRADQFLSELPNFGNSLNTFKTEANTTVDEINLKASQVAQDAQNAQISATTATQKAALAQSVVIPTASTYNNTTQDWRQSMMSKAEFNAVAAERRANRAGSGADEMGKGNATTTLNVNEGIHTSATAPNTFYLGKAGGSGTSKTDHYVGSINGSIVACKYLNTTTADATIVLPPSPTVLPYDAVLTTEQIAMGVIKHADSSNSGLITLGTGLNGTSISRDVITVIGKSYTVEWIDNGTRNTSTFTATATTTNITKTGTNITRIACFPADAISRSDLVLLESWHEDVSEKDFVYPLGNVQYLGGVTDGMSAIVAGAFSGSGTYSLFGNWQASGALVGKGYVWSGMNDANKKAFVSNHENSSYLDGDKVIQVKDRMRVVMGLGDSWQNVDPQITDLLFNGNQLAVSSKGKESNYPDLISRVFTSRLYQKGNTGDFSAYYQNGNNATIDRALATNIAYEGKCFALPIALVHRRNQGAYHPVYNPNGTKLASDSLSWYSTTVSFTSIADCFDSTKLLTASGYIGTSSGRPDGLFYDQVHESDIVDLRMSSAKVEDYNRLIDREFNKLVAGAYRGSEREWGIAQTITSATATYNSAINAFSTTDADFPFTLEGLIGSGHGCTFGVLLPSTFIMSPCVVIDSVGVARRGLIFVTSGNTFIRLNGAVTTGLMYICVLGKSTRTKSNTLTHCDIIGNPTNYPTVFKQSGVSGVPLIVAEDGTSMLPTGTLATFKLSRKANATPLQVLKSTDSGSTWTALTVTTHYTFSTTTNVLTMVTAPATTDLIMVTYQTHTGMVVPAVNSEVLAIGDAWANNNNGFSAIAQSLIGKQLVQIANNDYTWSAPLSQKGIGLNVTPMFKTGVTYPSHPTVVFYGTTAPAVKTFPYLTRSNGKARLQLVFKEMKHNGTTWGDDSKFNIVDNVSTTTDNNAQTVLIGQKYAELPYFIGASE